MLELIELDRLPNILKIADQKTFQESFLKYKDHALSGNYKNYRECHIKPDLLLIYKIEKSELILYAVHIGSHSDLFKK